MLKKIFSFFIIFFVLYILLIFTAPKLAEGIESNFGLNGFNEFVLGFKSDLDNTSTNIPTEGEIHKKYYTFVDWTVNFIHRFIDGVNIIKGRIDKFREDIEKKKQKVEDIKETYDNVKEIINTASGAIQKTTNTLKEINSIKENIYNTGIINN